MDLVLNNQLPEMPALRSKLKDLLRDGLAADYEGVSCQDGIVTGNHYQSILLDGAYTDGYRTPRTAVMDQINFTDLKVLDLGSNLGETSRYARTRGANLVDGFEYDQHFLDLANLINAYERMTRVSFYRRDITDKSVYRERYDIVLALSVFIYVKPLLDLLASITDCLLLETHRLDNNYQSVYLDPIQRYFPHHRTLGDSEWLTTEDAGIRRRIAVFTKTSAQMAERLFAETSSVAAFR